MMRHKQFCLAWQLRQLSGRLKTLFRFSKATVPTVSTSRCNQDSLELPESDTLGLAGMDVSAGGIYDNGSSILPVAAAACG
jgi:hypothetical protein